ncbi:tumor necrosis factor receptor superfamily member 1A [Cyprinodon tularosa]|uniref:tumor necrosis factor receptor superfamily member 1A n=1 Tax=Cyprinodon tularosa TaxID=77115 RepID=UPI0018E23DFA|nr:tumor necrosis factor receptor superfamily member 1A [Cyprinodon tularosa]
MQSSFTLRSLVMDSIWVVFLILSHMITGPGLTEAKEYKCVAICPPGFHKNGSCKNGTFTCTECPSGTFTSISNTRDKCVRCGNCGRPKDEKQPCTTTSNVVCNCSAGEYSKEGGCEKCSSTTGEDTSNKDYVDKCLSCQSEWCKKNRECWKNCSLANTPDKPVKDETKTPTTSTTTRTSNPIVEKVEKDHNHLPWNYLLGAFGTLLALLLLLLLLCNLFRKKDVLPCWTTKKDLGGQTPGINEPHSHHCSSPTTLTFGIHEETPMMPLCQEPSAYINCYVQRAVPAGVRQHDYSGRWPAIVLYEIIKEVPLRRWKEFLRLLSVPDQQMERVELETTLGSMEQQYQMLRLWSQRSSASLKDVYSSLHHMDLSGCAQQLQENLESLQWKPEVL